MNRLEAVSILCNERIAKCYKQFNINWTKEKSDELKEQILQIGVQTNHVRQLIRMFWFFVFNFVFPISYSRSLIDQNAFSCRLQNAQFHYFNNLKSSAVLSATISTWFIDNTFRTLIHYRAFRTHRKS